MPRSKSTIKFMVFGGSGVENAGAISHASVTSSAIAADQGRNASTAAVKIANFATNCRDPGERDKQESWSTCILNVIYALVKLLPGVNFMPICFGNNRGAELAHKHFSPQPFLFGDSTGSCISRILRVAISRVYPKYTEFILFFCGEPSNVFGVDPHHCVV